MIIDSSLEMCDATSAALGTIDGITKVGNAVDLHPLSSDNATVDLSAGEKLYLVIEVTTLFAGGTNAAYKIDLTTSTDAALTGGTTANIWTTGSLLMTSWTAGTRYIASLPEADYHRYLGIRGTAVTANVTSGNINAFITKNVTNWTSTDTRIG